MDPVLIQLLPDSTLDMPSELNDIISNRLQYICDAATNTKAYMVQ